ncbi:complex 1 protein [Teladorsagia circumcincta]|uniref:Complex 1 protein n=1 Tax=Teladorsagia circumcincta TaxID=45464 RepID=A0A2G9U0J0_TELCI|nr:complex 1 protein [Teladorsagia circumcincta]
MNQRARVISVYKQLYHLGKDYPKGKDWFHTRLKAAFLKNQNEKDPKKIDELIARAEFVVKEVEALYYLRKYRAMKNRYYEEQK